jgi:TPR repeat protein
MALGQGSGTPDGWYPDILTQTDYNKLWLTKDGFVLKVSRPVSYEDKTDAVTVTTQGYLDRFSSKQAQEKADLVSSLSSPIAVPVHVATAEELKALSEAREAGRAKAEAAAVAFNQAAADRGDAYGLLRMGERYRDGEGVARDLPKARAYLAKSAAAGNSQAERELSAMKNP